MLTHISKKHLLNIAFIMTQIPTVHPSVQPSSNLPLFIIIHPDTLKFCVIHGSVRCVSHCETIQNCLFFI